MQRAWLAARAKAAVGRRRTSRAAAVMDVVAATPLISSSSLAAALDMVPKNAIALLDTLRADRIVVDVTHRARRRLFALAGVDGFVALREAVARPTRPVPGRGPGRPRRVLAEDTGAPSPTALPPLPPVTPMAFAALDTSGLDAAMAVIDALLPRGRAELCQPEPEGSRDG